MKKTTVFDEQYATMWYYPDHRIVHHVYHKFIHGQPFRDVLETGLRLIQENGGGKWLSDDRKNSALPTEDLVWSMQDWAPRCMAAGWTHWAVIMPDKIAGQLNMNRIFSQYKDSKTEVRVFDDVDEALEWLMSV